MPVCIIHFSSNSKSAPPFAGRQWVYTSPCDRGSRGDAATGPEDRHPEPSCGSSGGGGRTVSPTAGQILLRGGRPVAALRLSPQQEPVRRAQPHLHRLQPAQEQEPPHTERTPGRLCRARWEAGAGAAQTGRGRLGLGRLRWVLSTGYLPTAADEAQSQTKKWRTGHED